VQNISEGYAQVTYFLQQSFECYLVESIAAWLPSAAWLYQSAITDAWVVQMQLCNIMHKTSSIDRFHERVSEWKKTTVI